MSTKTLLEKAMLKIGARSGSPSTARVSYTPTVGGYGHIVEFVAPADGFVTAFCISGGPGCFVEINVKAGNTNAGPSAGNGFITVARVRKGESGTINFNAPNANYPITADFIYAEGGLD